MVASIALATLSHASIARAQEPTKADLDKARTLFRDAVALAAANNCAAAIVKYKEVAQVKMTPQVAFNTAECDERLGKLVEALGNYRIAVSQAEGDKKAANVIKEAAGRIEGLEGRIPKLTVARGKGADDAVVSLDGAELGSNQLGVAIPVDPGPHTIVAKVGDKEYLHESVNVAEKEKRTFEVKLNIPKPKIEQPPPEQPPEPPPPPPKSRVPGIATTVAGGAVMIVGFAMLGPRAGAISQLTTDCAQSGANAGHCPMKDQDVANRGKLFTGLTEIMVPVGAAVTAVGIVLIARSGPQKTDKDKEGDKGEKKDALAPTFTFAAGAPGSDFGFSFGGRF